MLIKDCINGFNKIIYEKVNKINMLRFYNMIECDLALHHFPLINTEYFPYSKVYYKDFKYSPIEIQYCDCEAGYISNHQYIYSLNKSIKLGNVRYKYRPIRKKKLNDKFDYGLNFINCIVAGMVAEYYLFKGHYNNAQFWERKYKDNIRKLHKLQQ